MRVVHPPRRVRRRRARSPTSGWIDAGVVNAGDGTHEHPTQALLDAFTMRKRLHGDGLARPRPRRRDASRSSATSCTRASPGRTSGCCTTLGAEVHARRAAARCCRPDVASWPVDRRLRPRRGASPRRPTSLMMLRIQASGCTPRSSRTSASTRASWGLDDERFARLARGYDGHASRPDEPRARDLGRRRPIRPARPCSTRCQRGVGADGRALPAAQSGERR